MRVGIMTPPLPQARDVALGAVCGAGAAAADAGHAQPDRQLRPHTASADRRPPAPERSAAGSAVPDGAVREAINMQRQIREVLYPSN